MGRLSNKIALITGAASGIGRSTAERFAEEGATVVLADRAEDRLAETLDTLRGKGGEHRAIHLDVTAEDAWIRATKEVDSAFGRLDVLVNNAGFGRSSWIQEMALEDWRSTIAVCLDSVFLGTKHSLALLARSGKGSIVNVSSISGLVAAPKGSAYSSAKAGVRLFTKTTALECAALGNGVRANSVHPGQVDTPFFAQVLADPEWTRATLARIPMGRIGKPEEIAALIVYLASDESSFMTGSELTIDGGYTAQ